MAIALKTLSRRLTGTRPGFASPQKTAPLTEPVQSPNATLYERDGWLAVSVYPPPRTNIGVDQQRGQVTGTIDISSLIVTPHTGPWREGDEVIDVPALGN